MDSISVLTFGVLFFAFALLYSRVVHYIAGRRRQIHAAASPPDRYKPIGELPPIEPRVDAIILLSAYEQAVDAAAQHLRLRVSPDEATQHARDTVTLQHRVRDLRNLILKRLRNESDA